MKEFTLGHGPIRMEDGQLRDDLSRLWCSCGKPAVEHIEDNEPPYDFVCEGHKNRDGLQSTDSNAQLIKMITDQLVADGHDDLAHSFVHLVESLQSENAEYKTLLNIMERARKIAAASLEDEEERPRFKMDADGNLSRIEY